MDVNPKQRRRHSAAFKAQVLAACSEPGASVAAVALSFGLNDNLVHQWRRGRGADPVPSAAAAPAMVERAREFIALSLPAPPAAAASSRTEPRTETIQLEFKRGALGVSVAWPVSAALDCAAWLRELL